MRGQALKLHEARQARTAQLALHSLAVHPVHPYLGVSAVAQISAGDGEGVLLLSPAPRTGMVVAAVEGHAVLENAAGGSESRIHVLIRIHEVSITP